MNGTTSTVFIVDDAREVRMGLSRLLAAADRDWPAVLSADRAWNTRVPTAALNRFLSDALARHPPPANR